MCSSFSAEISGSFAIFELSFSGTSMLRKKEVCKSQQTLLILCKRSQMSHHFGNFWLHKSHTPLEDAIPSFFSVSSCFI